MVKSGMTAALASSVAALAASAAKAKPSRQVKSANNKPPAAGGGARGRVKLDPDQENASSKTMSKEHRKLVADNEGGGEDAPAVLATDQTKVLVSGLGADTAAEDLEDAFRCTSVRLVSR